MKSFSDRLVVTVQIMKRKEFNFSPLKFHFCKTIHQKIKTSKSEKIIAPPPSTGLMFTHPHDSILRSQTRLTVLELRSRFIPHRSSSISLTFSSSCTAQRRAAAASAVAGGAQFYTHWTTGPADQGSEPGASLYQSAEVSWLIAGQLWCISE